MSYHNPAAEAAKNFRLLSENPYPGRGMICGLNQSGSHLVLVYWIMGRSENSRNRVFKYDGDGLLRTDAADPAKVKDPKLIIYNAMKEDAGVYVVSNGEQTDAVLDSVVQDNRFGLQDEMRNWDYEPDAPNYTQRITGVMCLNADAALELHVTRKSQFSMGTDQLHYQYETLGSGFGWCITTYSGDGNPLPPLVGEPLLMPLEGDMDTILGHYWDALSKENRIAIAVKFVNVADRSSKTHLINQYQQVR